MKKKQEIKPADWKFFAVLVARALALGGAIFCIFLTQPGTRATTQQVRPPYFLSAEAATPFPQMLDPSQFSSRDIAAAYRVAQKAPGVLAQQPCFAFAIAADTAACLIVLPQDMELTATFA
jgi:hypothetical protein